MKISLSHQPFEKLKADLAVAVIDPEGVLIDVDNSVLGQALKDTSKAFKRERYQREFLLNFGDKAPVKALLVFSSALEKNYDLRERVKIFAARSLGYASDYGHARLAFLLNGPSGSGHVGCATEGYILGDYRFDKYRKDKTKRSISVSLVCRATAKKTAERELMRYRIVSEEVNRARDLVNEPGDKVLSENAGATRKEDRGIQ